MQLPSMDKKKSSSSLTFVYKVFFPAIWAIMIAGLTGFTYWESGNEWTFLILLMILPMLIFVKIKSISFDNDFIFVSNGLRMEKYEMERLKSVNEGNIMSLDPFFELEILDNNGEVKKIDFMPKIGEQLKYQFTGKITGRLGELKESLRNKSTGYTSYRS